jgi:hypothetical protein
MHIDLGGKTTRRNVGSARGTNTPPIILCLSIVFFFATELKRGK